MRQINDVQATVKEVNEKFYIVEQGTIDTRLNTCALAQEFRVNNLKVTVSGDVKMTSYTVGEPCCNNNFVITNIRK